MFKARYTVAAALAVFTILGGLMPQKLIIESQTASATPLESATATTTHLGNKGASSIALSCNKAFSEGPIIKLKPNSDSGGAEVKTNGGSFSPGQTLVLLSGKCNLPTGNSAHFVTGEFSTTTIIPENATAEDHDVKVASSAGEDARSVFKIDSGNATMNPPLENKTLPTGGATSTPGIHIATIVLTPASAGTGSRLIVAGSAFGKDQNVSLTIDSKPFDANQTITTDANGDFIVIVTVPLDITPGNHNITAKDDSSVEASTTLAVTKTPGR
jgi:hypothetical protein